MMFERVAYFTKEEGRVLLDGLIPLSIIRYYNHTHFMLGHKFYSSLSCDLPFKKESLVKLKLVYLSLLSAAKEEGSLSLWGYMIDKAVVLVDTTLNLFNT